MAPQITPAHYALLEHLMDEVGAPVTVIPAGLAGHHPHDSALADLAIQWPVLAEVVAHPADPARLLVEVLTGGRRIVVALDHLAHLGCAHPVCEQVVGRLRGELAEVPADGALFATTSIVRDQSGWPGSELPYLVHIQDYLAATERGWDGTLPYGTSLWRCEQTSTVQPIKELPPPEPVLYGPGPLLAWLREDRGGLYSHDAGARAAVAGAPRLPGAAVAWSPDTPNRVDSVEPVAVCTDRWLAGLPAHTPDTTEPYTVSREGRRRIVHVTATNGRWRFLAVDDIDPALVLGADRAGWALHLQD